jgi:hypothetical protein
MNKLFLAGAAALILASGTAFAQTTPAPEQGGPAAGPSDDMQSQEDVGTARDQMPPWMRGDGRGRGMMRGDGRGMGMMGRPGMRRSFMRHHAMMASPGAMFVFDRGRGEGKIVIKCAAQDSTKACADAVQPMLQMMMQGGDE